MADANTPFKRLGEGENSWEDLLIKVNQELENPPEDTDCEPIEPIEVPDSMHRWAKSDVREVHDKLKEMPQDCFTFEEIPNLWRVSTIREIEDQLENSWCDCKSEFCCRPCTNAGITAAVFIKSISSDACESPLDPFCGPGICEGENCSSLRADLKDAHDLWEDTACEYCDLFLEVEVLKNELTKLENELAVLEQQFTDCPAGSPGDACRVEIQIQIDAKQIEIDAKQVELDAKIVERDEKKLEKEDAQTDIDTLGPAVISCLSDCCVRDACIDILPTSGFPPAGGGSDDTCEDHLSNIEGTNFSCCGSCRFKICTSSVFLQSRRYSDSQQPGSFFDRYSGFIDAKGNPLILLTNTGVGLFGQCCCELSVVCSCTKAPNLPCTSLGGVPFECICDEGRNEDWQYKLINPRTFEPFKCEDGSPCDEEEEEGEGEE